MRFSKYFNHESGNRNIYTQNNLLHMTLDELLEKELELAYQYNTIGIPLDEELLSSSYAHQYMAEKGLPRWRAGEEMSNVSKQKMMEGFGDDATAEQMPEVYQSEINPKEQAQIQPAAAQTQEDINWGQVAQLAGEGLKFGIDKIKQRRSEAQIPSMQPQTNQNPIPADIASQDLKQLLPQGDVPAQENPQIQTTQKPKNPWGERLLKMAAVAADGIANPKSESEIWNQVAQSLGKGIRFGIDKYKQKRSKVEGVATGTEPVIGQEALENSEDFVEEIENKPDFTLLPRLTEREPEYSWGDKRYVNSLQGRQTNETESEYVKRVIEEGFERERPIVKEEPYLTYEELYGEPEGTPTGAAVGIQKNAEQIDSTLIEKTFDKILQNKEITRKFFPAAADMYTDSVTDFSRARVNKNAKVLENMDSLDSNTVAALRKYGVRSDEKGVYYDEGSDISKKFGKSKELKQAVERALESKKSGGFKGEDLDFEAGLKDVFSNMAQVDKYSSIQHAKLIDAYVDKQGRKHGRFIDNYDFKKRSSWNPKNIPNNYGHNLQKKGLLKNYYTVIDVIIEEDE